MGDRTWRGVVLSDFNADNFVNYANQDDGSPSVVAVAAPFGQVVATLTQGDLEIWKGRPDFAVIWTQPEGVVEHFGDVLTYRTVPEDVLLEEVDQYCAAVLGARDRCRILFVPTWVWPSYHRGYGLLEMRPDTGVAYALMRMNLRLSERLAEAPNIFVLNAQKWIEAAGKSAFSPKLWYMAKIAYGNEVYLEAVRDIKAGLRGVAGDSRKLVVVDLDDTLWGGSVGEVGWEDIRLGGHDHVGEAFVDFQRALKSLTGRGILLGIVSKNEEAVALEALREHPEMVLRPQDFAGWRIDWGDKAQNILDLVSELNLGLRSAVFIDNSPVERARVKDALSEVYVPEWPDDAMLFRSALLGLRCFDAPAVSKEDSARHRMYQSERKRQDLKKEIVSFEDWLAGLGIAVKVEGPDRANLPRIVQLLNRTNQMNLSTRRMTESELDGWLAAEDRALWSFRVSDRFGDSGLTGVVSVETEGRIGRIVDFVLSCRVIGRKVEETMLYAAIQRAKRGGLEQLRATYVPTPMNKPCLDFLKRSGLENEGRDFTWELSRDYPCPLHIEIEDADGFA